MIDTILAAYCSCGMLAVVCWLWHLIAISTVKTCGCLGL